MENEILLRKLLWVDMVIIWKWYDNWNRTETRNANNKVVLS